MNRRHHCRLCGAPLSIACLRRAHTRTAAVRVPRLTRRRLIALPYVSAAGRIYDARCCPMRVPPGADADAEKCRVCVNCSALLDNLVSGVENDNLIANSQS